MATISSVPWLPLNVIRFMSRKGGVVWLVVLSVMLSSLSVMFFVLGLSTRHLCVMEFMQSRHVTVMLALGPVSSTFSLMLLQLCSTSCSMSKSRSAVVFWMHTAPTIVVPL